MYDVELVLIIASQNLHPYNRGSGCLIEGQKLVHILLPRLFVVLSLRLTKTDPGLTFSHISLIFTIIEIGLIGVPINTKFSSAGSFI